MEISGVLWDMDGTIVDTEPYWIAAEHRLMEEFGLPWTDEDGLQLVGNALSVSADVFISRGVPLGQLEIINRLTADVVAQVREHVPFRPGAQELLAELRDLEIPCAMVTMSFKHLAQTVAECLPEGTFRTVITGDQVTHGKPHPEPYEVGAQALGVSAGTCVAIEDSRTGGVSAAAAGARTIVVPCHVKVPTDPRWTLLPSLEGLSVQELFQIATARRSQ